MAGQVEGQPAIAEGTGLKAGRIGHRNDKRPARGQGRCRMTQSLGRLAEVLKRMPEDDRRPGPVHLFEIGNLAAHLASALTYLIVVVCAVAWP